MLEVHDGRLSSRVKGLVDVVVYARTCEVDGETLAEQVAKEAAVRKVSLPATFSIPDMWFESYEAIYEKMARQARADGIEPDLASAQQIARTLYAPTLGAAFDSIKWGPSDLQWLGKPDL